MPEPVFVIRNQHGLYLTRQNEWVDGYDAAPLFKAAFRDIALNTLIELNAKDIELRGTILEVEVNDKGLPQVTPAEHDGAVAGAVGQENATQPTADLVDALAEDNALAEEGAPEAALAEEAAEDANDESDIDAPGIDDAAADAEEASLPESDEDKSPAQTGD